MGAKRPSASALGGKSNVKPNGRRRCDGADYETVSPIISKKVYGNSWEILFYDLPILHVGHIVYVIYTLLVCIYTLLVCICGSFF